MKTLIPAQLEARAKQIRRDTLKFSVENGGYHLGGSFSVVEILIALYDYVKTDDDVVIMSKGHAWWPQQIILRERGMKPEIVGHPGRDEANGIVCNTGSLGHGMPIGLGIAFARSLQKKPGHTFVIIGDGEAQEGTFWESLLLGNRFKLDNLTVICDFNGIQGSGRTEDILPIHRLDLVAIAGTAGWTTTTCGGHNIPALVDALEWGKKFHSEPTFILAETVKGKGVSFMEDQPSWHARFPTPEELEQAYKELA